MASTCIVTLKLIIDLCGSLHLFLKAVRADQRSGAVHFIEIANFLGDREVRRGIVKLLTDKLVAENGRKLLCRDGLVSLAVEKRRGLFLHIGADVVPSRRELAFLKIDFVRDLLLV
jgi:hypothetical protein